MNWKNFATGVGIGVGIGAALGISCLLHKKCACGNINPEKALSIAKDAFTSKGELSGSWIQMIPEQFEQYGLTYEVYRGGITVKETDQHKRYEFLVDATTGSVIYVSEVDETTLI